jgi:Carboxypeptidase regulatory-like domain
MFDIITNREMLKPSRGLYCVWIRANQNENAPLVRVWIDPSMKMFESGTNEQAPAATLRPDSPEMSDCEAEGQEASQAHEEIDHFRWSLRPVLSFLMLACIQFLALPSASAQTAGKVSGVVRDKTGAVIAGATVAATNSATGVKQTTKSDVQGSYCFPVLPIGQYEIEVTSDGFKLYRKTGLVIDINSAVVDVTLQLSEQSQNITVSVTEDPVQVEATDTQLGEVIGSKQVAEIPLNGRSYTDLFSTQVGVPPITTSGAGNGTSGGGFGTVPVAGNGNTGQFSINGQRESSNGFMLNGASVQESIGQQAGIIPNLDSIAEVRILTSNTDAEYRNYSGGLINVVTKSGGNNFHGSLFEFLRNTGLDSKGFFSPERSTLKPRNFGL